ncbi:MAG: hypothetical protein PHG75_01900 [Syntrophomonas sp.]|nr:hypothetical protein [Syntrophomonas sp.]
MKAEPKIPIHQRRIFWQILLVLGILIPIGVVNLMNYMAGPAAPDPDRINITLSEYEECLIGMTYEEVVAIIDGPGTVISESEDTKTYLFESGSMYANASLTFKDNLLYHKEQWNLKY